MEGVADKNVEEIVCDLELQVTTMSALRSGENPANPSITSGEIDTNQSITSGENQSADLTKVKDVDLEMDPLQHPDYPHHTTGDEVMDVSKERCLDTPHVPDCPVIISEHGDDKLLDNRVQSQDNRGDIQVIEIMPNNNQVMTQYEADDVVEDDDVAMIISIETTDDVEDDDTDNKKENSTPVVELLLVTDTDNKKENSTPVVELLLVTDTDNKKENSTPVVELLLVTDTDNKKDNSTPVAPVVELLLVKPPFTDEGREDLEDVHYPKNDVPCQHKEGVGSFSPRTNTKLIPNDVIEYLDRMKQDNEDLKLRLAGKEYDLEMLKKLTNASSEIIASKDKEIYFLQSDLELMRCNLSADQNKDTKIQELQERLNIVVQLSREKDEKISQLEDEIQNLRSVGVQQCNPRTALDPRPTVPSSHEDSQDLMVKSKTCSVM